MPFSNIELSSANTTTIKLTNDGRRPFTKDVFDLFSALILQLDLCDHRSFFRTYPSTFTTDEATKALASLEFTHVQRNKTTLTRTTTTFCMDRIIAKALLQQFLNTRLMVLVTDPSTKTIKDKAIWALTSKGKRMILDFGQLVDVPVVDIDTDVSIFCLGRIKDTDQLALERTNLTDCFRLMMMDLPLENLLADDVGGHLYQNTEYAHTFYGSQCLDWIMQYTTVVNGEEGDRVGYELVMLGWIAPIPDQLGLGTSTSLSRNGLYHLTERGRVILGWIDPIRPLSTVLTSGDTTHFVRLHQILADPLLRTHFRTHLQDNFCDENINFWVDYYTMRHSHSLDALLTIYDRYLKPNAVHEVNIDHSLRQKIDGVVAKSSSSSQRCLDELLRLYDQVNAHLCRILAEDAVPKFLRAPKYQKLLTSHLPPMAPKRSPSGLPLPLIC